MLKNKRIVFLSLLITLFLFSTAYGEVRQVDVEKNPTEIVRVLEGSSEIKYGPFGGEDYSHVILDTDINKLHIQSIESASNYHELRDLIHKNMSNYQNNFTIRYTGNESTLQDDISKMWDEIFDKDYYLYGTIISYGAYGYRGVKGDINIDFQGFTYHTTREQEDFVDQEIKRIADELMETNQTDFEKVKAVNDWIVNNTKYREDTQASPHAAYSLLAHGEGVCQAYALTANRLFDEMGIESVYVTGIAWTRGPEIDPIDHAWNLVKLDGEWYHLDTTWNDPVHQSGIDVLSYGYFLKSDAAMSVDHAIDNRITYPEATSNKYQAMWDITNAYEDNNFIYYSNHSDKPYNIYKFDLSSLESSVFLNENAPYIAGYDGWIYFADYSKGGYIYRVGTDGTGPSLLNKTYSADLFIRPPYLYFHSQEDGQWKIVDLDNPEGNLLSLNRIKNISLTVDGEVSELEAKADGDVYWSSSKPSVATVTSTGQVRPVSKGKATITVRTKEGNLEATIDVRVKDGYKILDLNNEEDSPKHPWTIELNNPVDKATVNYDNIYIENQYGDKINGANFDLDLTQPTEIIITTNGQYQYDKNQLYYVVVEGGLRSTEGKYLKEPVKLPFIIK